MTELQEQRMIMENRGLQASKSKAICSSGPSEGRRGGERYRSGGKPLLSFIFEGRKGGRKEVLLGIGIVCLMLMRPGGSLQAKMILRP